jgi:hypothetical protein
LEDASSEVSASEIEEMQKPAMIRFPVSSN